MTIKTLSELRHAFEFGRIPSDAVLVVGEKNAGVWVDGKCVFNMQPHKLLDEALDMLNIPHEEDGS